MDLRTWEGEDRETEEEIPDADPPPPAPFLLTYVYACGCQDTLHVWPGAPDFFPRDGPCPDCWLRHSLYVAWVPGEVYP